MCYSFVLLCCTFVLYLYFLWSWTIEPDRKQQFSLYRLYTPLIRLLHRVIYPTVSISRRVERCCVPLAGYNISETWTACWSCIYNLVGRKIIQTIGETTILRFDNLHLLLSLKFGWLNHRVHKWLRSKSICQHWQRNYNFISYPTLATLDLIAKTENSFL